MSATSTPEVAPTPDELDGQSTTSLVRETAGGLAWSWLAIVVTAVLQLLYTAIMSRLLEPADFGLLGAGLIGLRFVSYLARFGLGSALIQRPSLQRSDIATAQTMAVGIGITTACLAVLISPGLAALVQEPEASGIMRWLAAGMFVGVLVIVPEALLRRAMRFRTLAICQVVSFAVGYLGIGVPMALRGWGVWSLVGASLGQGVVLLGLTTLCARPPFRPRFDRASARSFASFGGLVTVTGFMEFLAGSVDTIAITRWIGAAGLGQYTRATYLVGLPVEHMTAAASRVLLPGLSRVQEDERRFARAYVMSSGPLVALVVVPMGMLAASAPALVPLILGPGWDTAASVMPIVGAAYGTALLTSLPGVATEARGALRRKVLLQALTLLATLSLIGLVGATGPTMHRLALAWFAGEVLRHTLYWILIFPRLGLNRTAIAARYAGALLMGAAAALPLFWLVRVMHLDGLGTLLLGGALGLILGGAVFASPMSRAIRDDVDRLRVNLRPRTP